MYKYGVRIQHVIQDYNLIQMHYIPTISKIFSFFILCSAIQSRLTNNHIPLRGLELCKVTHCAGCILANTRPHQLCWGDQKMGIAIPCIISNQVEHNMKKLKILLIVGM